MPSLEFTSNVSFQEIISKGLVILDFWAVWCKPCTAMNQTFDQLADNYSNIKFIKIEAEKFSEITEKFNISSVPSFVFLQDGKVIDQISGANGPDLINKITKYNTDSGEKQESKVDIKERLEKLVNFAPVMLFMKGSPAQPQCGFSSKIVELLKKANIVFSTFNILSDEEVRNGLKVYSNWPTYPQLYIKGKLIGGLDIVKEMFEERELISIIPPECISISGLVPETLTNPPPVSASPIQDLNSRLENLINSSSVMLFMKGTPEAPKCGFSGKIVDILNKNNIQFGSFNILTDDEIRQGLKTFSNWPTFPQLYAKGKLIGGLDIVKELSDEGELVKSLQ